MLLQCVHRWRGPCSPLLCSPGTNHCGYSPPHWVFPSSTVPVRGISLSPHYWAGAQAKHPLGSVPGAGQRQGLSHPQTRGRSPGAASPQQQPLALRLQMLWAAALFFHLLPGVLLALIKPLSLPRVGL